MQISRIFHLDSIHIPYDFLTANQRKKKLFPSELRVRRKPKPLNSSFEVSIHEIPVTTNSIRS